ncbi:MAG: NAD(P)-binding protein, partial [Rubrimonas sp.]
RAVLAANMETAVNACWDAAPRVGDRIAVIGAGVVGALVAWLLARHPGTAVELIDVNPDRAGLAAALGVPFAPPGQARDGCDLVVHASASEAGGGGFEPSGGGGGQAEGRQARIAEARALLATLAAAIGAGDVEVDGMGGRVGVLHLVERVAIFGDGLAAVLEARRIKRSRGRVAALFDALDAAMGRAAQAVGLEAPRGPRGQGMRNGRK